MGTFQKKVQAIANQRSKKAVRVMTINAYDVLGEAVKRAPVKEGDLRALSGAKVFTRGRNIIAEVFFLMPYAAYQHEGEDFVHPKGGEAKFLTKAIKAHKDKFFDGMAKT